jgi:hypothetical protein
VGAFYARHAEEGNQILQNKPFKSVETIRGYTRPLASPAMTSNIFTLSAKHVVFLDVIDNYKHLLAG